MAKQVSDLIVERLIEWGVDTIFGFPGDGVDGFFESLRTHQDKLRFIQVRHEEAAAFAAVGYAKYTGRLGVCCATSGPGGVHLLNGLYDAKCDLQPVLAITGHTFHDLIGMDYQQDVDLDKLYMDVSVFNERVMGPAHAVNVVDMAVRTAYGRRGVSHICIPKDIQEWPVSDKMRSNANIAGHSGDWAYRPRRGRRIRCCSKPPTIINDGSKVTILVGRGALGCARRSRAAGRHRRRPGGEGAARQSGLARSQPLHHRRPRPAWHRALGRRHGRVRHADHDRHQLSVYGISAQAWSGEVRADRASTPRASAFGTRSMSAWSATQRRFCRRCCRC